MIDEGSRTLEGVAAGQERQREQACASDEHTMKPRQSGTSATALSRRRWPDANVIRWAAAPNIEACLESLFVWPLTS